jgi:hypothetical protein
MDQQLGRAFNSEVVRREIEAITTLEEAKRAAHLLLQQIEIQRQTMDLLIRMDWDSNDHVHPTSTSEQGP